MIVRLIDAVSHSTEILHKLMVAFYWTFTQFNFKQVNCLTVT